MERRLKNGLVDSGPLFAARTGQFSPILALPFVRKARLIAAYPPSKYRPLLPTIKFNDGPHLASPSFFQPFFLTDQDSLR